LLRGLAVHAMIVAAYRFNPSVQVLYSIALLIDLAFFWGLRRRLPQHWVAVFIVSTLIFAAEAYSHTEHYSRVAVFLMSSWPAIRFGCALLDGLTVLWAIGRDRRSGAPADGLHLLGVGTVLFSDAFGLISSLFLLV
jgi:hypothetical protein